jgi:LysR family hydrogen peroxide-inducible transcriptional activator
VTFRQLEYLCALDRERSFAAAARRCHVSQPTLVEQIEKLESRMGKLVLRSRRGVSFTPLGSMLAARAARLLDSAAEFERLARFSGSVRVGMIDTVAPYLMPGFLASRPERIIPSQSQTAVLLDALQRSTLEAAVLAGSTFPEGFQVHDLGSEELLLSVRRTDEAFASFPDLSCVPLALASDHDMLLLADGHCLRDQVRDVCSASRSSFGPLQAATLEMLVEMVAADLGVTLVPAISAGTFSRHPGVKLLRLNTPPMRSLHLVTTAEHNAAVSPLVDSLRAVFADACSVVVDDHHADAPVA